MVDHTFLFTGAVRKIRQLIDDGTLGKLYYYDSTRVNLGLFQHDVNVIWDLAPHDLSIMDYLIEPKPERLVATGQTPPERPRGRGLHHGLLPRQHDRAHQRELALAGEGADDADRRREEDAGLERPGGRREDQGLRQGRRDHERPGRLRPAGQLPLRRHVGAQGRADRGAGRGSAVLRRLHREGRSAVQRRRRRLARREAAGGGRPVASGHGERRSRYERISSASRPT